MVSKLPLIKLSPVAYWLPPAVPTTAAQEAGTSATTRSGPGLVLLSAWMGAQLRHVDQYASKYRDLYPQASILILRSSPRDFWSLRNSLAQSLAPAVELLRSHEVYQAAAAQQGQRRDESRVLVHVFSNGGCSTLRELNELLRKAAFSSSSSSDVPAQERAFQALPARALIFDSCPGHSTLRLTLRAFTAGIKNKLVKYPSYVFFTLLYGAIKLWDTLLRRPPTLVRLSTYLNTPTLFPSSPRLYLYSATDLLVPSADVEVHAAQAEANGVRVRRERFEGTQHVAHMRGEEGRRRYWRAVEGVWEESGRREGEE
ncbi:hypothetical protein JCM8547_004404 [Rhodosporidiobolus lusitaniae]